MSRRLANQAITSAATYVWSGAGLKTEDFQNLTSHSMAVSGVGSATITVDLGEGDEAVAVLATGTSDVFYYPGAISFDVTATGGDISVTFFSFGDAS